MQKLVVLGLVMMGLGISEGFGAIVNGGDSGILVASVPNNPESAADMPGDVIGWYQPGTLTCTSNITEVQTATTIVRIVPQTIYTKKNGTFTVNIEIVDVKDLTGLHLYLFYQPSKVSIASNGTPSLGSLLKQGGWSGYTDIYRDKGYIELSYIATSGDADGTGTVVENIIFETLADNPTSDLIFGSTTLLATGDYIEIPVALLNGHIYSYQLDHFNLLAPKDVIAARPFTTTVTAKDQEEKVFSDYKGTIVITSNPGTISYTLSNFIGGKAVATITRYAVGTMTIKAKDIETSIATETGSIIVRYLCDFGGSLQSENPNNTIAFEDLVWFAKYWRSQDPKGDIGGQNQSGNPPYIQSQPDGAVEFWDLVIFAKMWRWFHGGKGLAETGGFADIGLSATKIEVGKDAEFVLGIDVKEAKNLLGANITLSYDPEKIALLSAESGNLFGQDEGFGSDLEKGEISLASFDIDKGVSASGNMLNLRFKSLVEDPESKIRVNLSYALTGNDIEIKDRSFEVCVEPAGPAYSALFQSVPNPAREGVWIPYQLAEGAEVEIKVYNILGQVVKNIDIGYKPKRFYKALEQNSAARWDLTNNSNQKVANGLYFYQLKAGKFSDTKAMAISR